MEDKGNFNEAEFLKSIRLSPAAIQALDGLFDAASPNELRENLLEIYHTYLVHAHHTLPLDFESLARNMYLLTSCLATIENELSGKS